MQPVSSRDRLLSHVVRRAATSPVSLFLTATGALLISSPVAWPLGVAAWVAEAGWLWTRIRDPEHARAGSEEMLRQRWLELVRRLEEISGSLDDETARSLNRIVEGQERLLAIYDAGGALVPHTRLELTSLLEHCLSLAQKRRQLLSYLASVRTGDVQREAQQYQARLEQCHDPVTRELYEQALDQKRQELENYVLLRNAVTRIDGQLAAVQCTFDNLSSRVVRLQTAEPLTREAPADPVTEELNQLSRGVASLEASLNEILALRAAG